MSKAQPAGRGRAGKAAPGKSKKAAPKKKGQKNRAKAPIQANCQQSMDVLRREQFVAALFANGMNGRLAAIAAGFSPESARSKAAQLLTEPDVQLMVQERQAATLARHEATQEMVLARLTSIATADARELTELHRGCCRYCWGKDNLFQRTPREMEEARRNWQADEEARKAKQMAPGPVFSEAGGVGYNPKRDPNPDCPECFGDGEARVVFKDTRDLSDSARLLYAGVEQTQHGLKVRTNSQTEALLNVGKHLGMFSQKVEVAGKNGGPVQHSHDLAQVFADLEGADTGVGPAAGRAG